MSAKSKVFEVAAIMAVAKIQSDPGVKQSLELVAQLAMLEVLSAHGRKQAQGMVKEINIG
jgi:hypothetical protein